jgi:hypothetical protein
VKNERALCFGVALGLSALSYGCGGYAHMNGQKVAEFIKEDLVRFGYCASSADCSQKKMILDVRIYAEVDYNELSAIVASVIRRSAPGKINMQFLSATKSPRAIIVIDKRD